jgi:hypothetical protein
VALVLREGRSIGQAAAVLGMPGNTLDVRVAQDHAVNVRASPRTGKPRSLAGRSWDEPVPGGALSGSASGSL